MRAPFHTGQCHCGSVRYHVTDLSDIWFCHCHQCQHLTGLYVAAARAQRENFTIEGLLNWYDISDRSRSAHCVACGSYLFWDMLAQPHLSVLAGSLDNQAGLQVKGHIFVSQKADYYAITDSLPQYDTYPPPPLIAPRNAL